MCMVSGQCQESQVCQTFCKPFLFLPKDKVLLLHPFLEEWNGRPSSNLGMSKEDGDEA